MTIFRLFTLQHSGLRSTILYNVVDPMPQTYIVKQWTWEKRADICAFFGFVIIIIRWTNFLFCFCTWKMKKKTHLKWTNTFIVLIVDGLFLDLTYYKGKNNWILNTTDTQWLHEKCVVKRWNVHITCVCVRMSWTYDIL